MTSMTSCIVGKKIGAVGSGHLELFPFVVLAICKCQNIETMLVITLAMAGGISEHMLTSWSSCLVSTWNSPIYYLLICLKIAG